MDQRCVELLMSGEDTDCTFVVGSETKQVIQAHKLVLAVASPVFGAMFHSGLSESRVPIVRIPDLQPDSFRALLKYIYTRNVTIDSMDIALNLWYGAKKYMMPLLETLCTNYIWCRVVPSNVCQTYEVAQLFEEKTIMQACIQEITTNTREVLNNSNFVDVELNTLITVCSLDNLNVNSELDLCHAVARYAEVWCPSELCVESSPETSPAAELDPRPPTEAATSEQPDTEENLTEEKRSIRGALQSIRFLSLTPQQFKEGPARSGLLTKDEAHAVLMNIINMDSPVPMPTGFSECREPRRPYSNSNDQSLEASSSDVTDNAPTYDPSQIEEAVAASGYLLSMPFDPAPTFNIAVLDALVPALTHGNAMSRRQAVFAITHFCYNGSPAQLGMVAASAALQPYCRLLAVPPPDYTCHHVLRGLNALLRYQEIATPALLQKMRAFGVRQLLMPFLRGDNEPNHSYASSLMLNYFLSP